MRKAGRKSEKQKVSEENQNKKRETGNECGIKK